MSERNNLEAVKRIYTAFGNGHIPGVLAELADDIHWWLGGPPEIPYAGTYCGHDGVLEFFQKLIDAIEIEQFEPREFIAQADQVVVIGYEVGRAKQTGCRFENNWVHVFSFGNTKVCRFHEFADTAALVAAFTGQCQE